MSLHSVPLDPRGNEACKPWISHQTATRLPAGGTGEQGPKSGEKATTSIRRPSQSITPPSGIHASRPDFDSEVCGFPRMGSPVSDSISNESMMPNVETGVATSRIASPVKHGSQGAMTAIKGLSLNDKPQKSQKRAAPTESSHWVDVQPPPKQPQLSPKLGKGRNQQLNAEKHAVDHVMPAPEPDRSRASANQVHHDSTYYSRSNTLDTKYPGPDQPDVPTALQAAGHPQKLAELNRRPTGGGPMSAEPHSAAMQPATPAKLHRDSRNGRVKDQPPQQWQPAMQKSTKHGYTGMILQPDSTPISEEQLAAEIKGIYDGVVTVEIKCIDIDAALARDTKSHLGVEQWQALIALHRTLLYEHHDFLMATQHPSASDNLKSLATKYSMPARMWKHGIHAFLEVLRHRRPDSQDYMLAFVVLAYQMMALLFETVPCFTDTWIECLGDLARYRMAIEDDREMHAVWGGVAARWYTLASDRHPEIGRLYHHLGILERPSMRKLTSYAKSLTCSIPFLNARDSMATFCKPIVQEEHLTKSNVGSAEASLVTFFALVFLSSEAASIESTSSSGLALLSKQPSMKTKDFGPQLVLASVSTVFEFGSSHNIVWQMFSAVINEDNRSARPSEAALPGSTNSTNTPSIAATSAHPVVIEFHFACFNILTRPQYSTQSNSDLLASVHVVLAWFHSLHSLGSRSSDASTLDTIGSLMDPLRFSWGGLCLFMNGLCQDKPIDENVFESARQGSFPGSREPEKFVPLSEDYWMRGLLWAQLYLPNDLLPARADEIESPLSGTARTQRVQWLALSLAFRTKYMKYDVHKKAFFAPVQGPLPQPLINSVKSITSNTSQTDFAPSARQSTWTRQSSVPTSPTSTSRSSATMSTGEDSDGFTLVPRQKSKPGRTWAKVAAQQPKKKLPDFNDVRLVDSDAVRVAGTDDYMR